MVDPNIWGKHGWRFIHYVAQGYPDNPTLVEKTDYKNFFLNLGKILPCYKCSENYKLHLQTNPLTDITLKNKNNLENWVISIHNQVNQLNQKSILSIDEAKNIIQVDDCENDNIKINIKKDTINKKAIQHLSINNESKYIVIICILIAINIFLFIKKC